MTPKYDGDWSDSDDDALSEVETSVLLGIPDGAVDDADINDTAVSRIGGHPAFLPSQEPSLSSASCNSCSNTMELLVQMWCPFEDSPHDRALYIWGCSRGSCQKKDGSVRAWRGLRFNEKYAAKLDKKLAKKRIQAKAKADTAAEAEKNKVVMKSNPFSMQHYSAATPFGLGTQIFGDSSAEAKTHPEEAGEASDAESEASASSTSNESMIIAMASTAIGPSPWASAPSSSSLYLSTTSEYLPPPPKPKLTPGARVQDPADDENKENSKNTSWAFEAYENSLEVDHVFNRFAKRVGHKGEQCVRYELNGVPLPFASDKVFDLLFPPPPTPPLPVTKTAFKVVPVQKRIYDPASLSPCPICKSKRVFECQLMPNLINTLRSGEADEKLTEKQRRMAVEKALKGGAPDTKGMSWGTCMIFSCEKDCCIDDDGEFEARECWREELVLIQWDD